MAPRPAHRRPRRSQVLCSPAPSPIPVREGTIPAAGGLLEPDTYVDWSLGPTLTFTVGDGWAATPVDAGLRPGAGLGRRTPVPRS